MADLSADRIRAQLERIISSQQFVGGRKPGQFLHYVVEQTLNGNQDTVTQYAIAVEALGYGKTFDPTTVPNVRVLARRLRRALDQYYLKQGADDPIRIDIPKGSYVPVFLDNHAATDATGSSECPSPSQIHKSTDSSKPSIAVILFDSLNDKEQFNYFASGLTEDIIIALTRFPDFVVVGPLFRDVLQHKGMELKDIGQRYGVRFVLDGSIRKRSDAIRLTVKLNDTVSGMNLWGQSIDYNLKKNSVLEIEDQLIGRVSATIADAYGVIPRSMAKESLAHRSESLSDYDAVLRFYHYFRFLEGQSMVEAIDALEKAIQKNPNNALTCAMLGDLVACLYQFGVEDSRSVLDRAEKLGRRAVALDPNCQAARFTMSLIYFLRGQRKQFLKECEQAIQLNPNNTYFLACLALHLAMVGEWERGVNLTENAMHLNPHYLGHYHWVPFMNHYRRGEYDLAAIEAQRFNAPEFFWDPLNRAAVFGQLGYQVEAKKAVDELLALVPDFEPRGRSLIRRFAYLDEHIDMLLEGLHKAGMKKLQ
jgi:TolB-like protein/Tfp pilus assembly protein PilF